MTIQQSQTTLGMMFYGIWNHLVKFGDDLKFSSFSLFRRSRGDPWNIFKIFQKYAKGGPLENFFFDFFKNTLFHSGRSYETIRMSFEGVRMLNTP